MTRRTFKRTPISSKNRKQTAIDPPELGIGWEKAGETPSGEIKTDWPKDNSGVTVSLNKPVVKDKNGHIVTDKPRPYQFEIRLFGLSLTSPWYCHDDSESERRVKYLAEKLGGIYSP